MKRDKENSTCRSIIRSCEITRDQIVASELKDPIWHSSEWQIGSFSSEATKCISDITGNPCDIAPTLHDQCAEVPTITTSSTLARCLCRRPSTYPTCAYGNVLCLPCLYCLRLKHEALNQCWPNMGPASQTVCQPQANIGLMCRVCWGDLAA